MRSRAGLFWQSLFLTLLLLVPMIGTVVYFSAQRQKQQDLRQVNAAQSGVAVSAGAQNTLRLMVAIQQEEPEFLLIRLDAPARQITLCGLPGGTVVHAPEGETTLADSYMAAGPARAAELLGATLGTAPDVYFAATAAVYAKLAGTDTTLRLDTAAVLTDRQRSAAGCGSDSVVELTAADAEKFLADTVSAAGLDQSAAARLRAALWSGLLRQNTAVLKTLPQGMRDLSARTLTNLDAQALYKLQDTLNYLAGESATTVEYTVLPGTLHADGRYVLGDDGVAAAAELLK